MEHVKKQDAVKHKNSSHCVVYEYPMRNSKMNIGVAEITRRYPDEGYAINHECIEMGTLCKDLESWSQKLKMFFCPRAMLC